MKKVFIVLIIMVGSLCAHAQSAIRAKQYAKQYGQYLMNQYGTSDAVNVETDITDVEMDRGDYIMEIEVGWDDKWGAIFKDPIRCVIKGVLTIAQDGSNRRFAETYRNDAFKQIAKGRRNEELIIHTIEGMSKQ